MTKIGKLKVTNAILCDDIRKEQGTNKAILIGVYSGDLVLPTIPADVQLAVYLELVAPAGAYVVEIKFSGPQKGHAIMKATLETARDGIGTIASPRVGINMAQEGVFRIDARVNEGRWTNLISKRVIQGAVPTS